VEILERHIKEAEKILINGKTFDNERLAFIRKLESCDLLAVPGSGKTTALLAKLYCLSKHLPFNDGSGILILGHTNETVNNIERNLKKYCTQLFEYPNFVGTIQRFVNTYLANPACLLKYGSNIVVNDNDFYDKEAIKFYYSLPWKKTEPKGLKNKIFGKVNAGKENSSLDFKEKEEKTKKMIRFFELDVCKRKIIYNDNTFYSYDGNSQSYYLELEQWKEGLYSKGILNYKDSFRLSEWYIENYSIISTILQHRFKYVFIDEMQDLEKFQIEIIDKIFVSDNSPTIIQRIGDINQAIYNSGRKVKDVADWQPRNPKMYISGSNRLTAENAGIVNFFTLDRQKDDSGQPRFTVNGLRKLESVIKPHLIIFEHNTKDKLADKFKELINGFSLQHTAEGKRYGFKIIGWSAKWDKDDEHEGKLRLEDIFTNYKKERTENKENLDSLSKYLQYYDKTTRTFKPVRNTILNALVQILRIEGKQYPIAVRGQTVNRYYTVREMLKVMQKNDYEYFKAKIYEWSFALATKDNYQAVYDSIKSFVQQEFREWFNLSISKEVQDFLGVKLKKQNFVNNESQNDDDFNDIKIDIGTVHSAKGQTHCATMYVETSYNGYETNKLRKLTKTKSEELLPNPLWVEEHSYKDKRPKEALKMMYVGFSRPTHLLCFAALKENVEDNIQKFKNAGWAVVNII
jgi:superfamily I DNA/RNA helicase